VVGVVDEVDEIWLAAGLMASGFGVVRGQMGVGLVGYLVEGDVGYAEEVFLAIVIRSPNSTTFAARS
jgi:hypothetical protein